MKIGKITLKSNICYFSFLINEEEFVNYTKVFLCVLGHQAELFEQHIKDRGKNELPITGKFKLQVNRNNLLLNMY